MDFIENLSIPIPLLFDKLATTSLLVQGAMKNEAEFGVGIVSIIEELGFPGVISLARSGPLLTKKSLNCDTISWESCIMFPPDRISVTELFTVAQHGVCC